MSSAVSAGAVSANKTTRCVASVNVAAQDERGGNERPWGTSQVRIRVRVRPNLTLTGRGRGAAGPTTAGEATCIATEDVIFADLAKGDGESQAPPLWRRPQGDRGRACVDKARGTAARDVAVDVAAWASLGDVTRRGWKGGRGPPLQMRPRDAHGGRYLRRRNCAGRSRAGRWGPGLIVVMGSVPSHELFVKWNGMDTCVMESREFT